MSYIDPIMTDQPAYVVETGVKPSLENCCQNHLIFGKLSMASPFPPTYRRTV